MVAAAVVLVDAMNPNQITVAAVVLIATHAGAFFVGYRIADNARLEQALQYEEERAILSAVAAAAESAARAEESRRINEVERIRRETRKQLDRAAADAAVASTVGEQLRQRVQTLAAACNSPASSAAAIGGGAPAGNGAVLADVFSEVERTGRAMAAEADRSRAAGIACERAYESLNNSGK